MKKNLTITLIGIVIVAAIVVGALNPLRKPGEKIKQALLKKTPLGTPKYTTRMPEYNVRDVIDRKGWLDGRYGWNDRFS